MTEIQLTPEQALAELMKLDLDSRRDLVAGDVGKPSPRYSGISPHDLAEALGVPDADKPGPEWSFTRYAEIITVEEYAMNNPPTSDVIYLIRDSTDPDRFAELLQLAKAQDDVDEPDFSFLTGTERSKLETIIAENQLEENCSNGMCCIGHFSVTTPSGDHLSFEGEIEDDGDCINLLTPYDDQANLFTDLSNCVTDEW